MNLNSLAALPPVFATSCVPPSAPHGGHPGTLIFILFYSSSTRNAAQQNPWQTQKLPIPLFAPELSLAVGPRALFIGTQGKDDRYSWEELRIPSAMPIKNHIRCPLPNSSMGKSAISICTRSGLLYHTCPKSHP